MITQNNSKMENTETSNSKKIRTYAFCFVIILINIIHLYLYDDSPLNIISVKNNGLIDFGEDPLYPGIINFTNIFLDFIGIYISIVFINQLLLMVYEFVLKFSLDTKKEKILIYGINSLYILLLVITYIYIKTYSD